MPPRTTKSTSLNIEGYLKYIWLIPLAIIGYPYLVRWMRKTEASDQIAELEVINSNPTNQSQALAQITPNTSIHSAALTIWEASGLSYPVWHYKHWTEDDNKMYQAIMSVSVGGVVPPALIQAYYIVSSGNNLKADMLSLLDAEYMNLLTW